MQKSKLIKRKIRHKRVRARIFGTKKVPRISVFRSNKSVYLQLIDDEKGIVIASSTDAKIKKKATKTEKAREAGKKLAEMALAKKIKKALFDRGGYKYHGRVKAAAEGLREGGLSF